MVKPELGTKRTCPSCAARFYDLMKNPIVCPKCQTSFIAAAILPSKGDMPSMPAQKPRPVVDDDPGHPADVELVSLEDAEPGADDETAGIEDVDLGEDAGDDTAGEEEAFLVEEEEGEGGVSNLIEGGPAGKEDEEEA